MILYVYIKHIFLILNLVYYRKWRHLWVYSYLTWHGRHLSFPTSLGRNVPQHICDRDPLEPLLICALLFCFNWVKRFSSSLAINQSSTYRGKEEFLQEFLSWFQGFICPPHPRLKKHCFQLSNQLRISLLFFSKMTENTKDVPNFQW